MPVPANTALVRDGSLPWEQVAEGVRRKVLGHGPDLMMVRVEFEEGAIGAIHHHPHRQVTYVVDGSFEVHVGDQCEMLGAGDCFYVQAEVPHGVVAKAPGTLIDVFTPTRADFLPGT